MDKVFWMYKKNADKIFLQTLFLIIFKHMSHNTNQDTTFKILQDFYKTYYIMMFTIGIMVSAPFWILISWKQYCNSSHVAYGFKLLDWTPYTKPLSEQIFRIVTSYGDWPEDNKCSKHLLQDNLVVRWWEHKLVDLT